ncbi:MAG: 3-oxoacyl-[acyl-carrier-protein] reductase [Andreesenia angusta]|nr:3-oxoacyl-[acyl-carrier-protein] reductase [Andreesenia angusta]
MNLIGKKALITGASRGLGKAIAIKLAELGADIVINDIGNEEEAESVVKEIESLGRNSLFIKADISDFEQAKELVDNALKEIGSIDIVVNNAGITRDNLLLRMSEEDFDSVIDVNLKGVFNITKSILRPILKTRNASIINISSIVGISGNAGQTNYSASKAGVIGFTKSLAKEIAKKNIRVNAIAPGFIETDMTEKLSDDIIESYKSSIPLGRLGTADDIANTVAFLASDISSYITGQVIVVDGGMI